MIRIGVGLLILACAVGCSRPLAQARTEQFQPPTPAERDARERAKEPRCDARRATLYPGGAQICMGKEREGAALAATATVELATGLSVAVAEQDAEHPGALLPLVAFSDLWVYSVADAWIERDLLEEERFTPGDSLADLLAAPLNWEVMKRPSVFLGLAGMLAAGIGVSLATGDEIDRDAVGDDPNLFGTTLDRRAGYPLGFGAQAALFQHVAIAEEAMFRGVIQSKWARAHGETWGWVEASLVFGAVHALNIFTLPKEQWREYLGIGVPFITALGGYMGWAYRQADYSLAPPVALHFWYDFLLSATFFVLDPQDSIVSAKLGWSF